VILFAIRCPLPHQGCCRQCLHRCRQRLTAESNWTLPSTSSKAHFRRYRQDRILEPPGTRSIPLRLPVSSLRKNRMHDSASPSPGQGSRNRGISHAWGTFGQRLLLQALPALGRAVRGRSGNGRRTPVRRSSIVTAGTLFCLSL